jgi:mitochondrial translocator assembly and maintenance protein 41
MNSVLQQIVSRFPQQTLRLAFAYGSGVFQQQGHKDISKNMIDFIFAVDDPVEWHKENLQKNRKHYSALGYLGPKYISYLQENIGARIYYNTLVSCEGRLIKYGVISTQSLIDDLMDWESLYVSGRLHKPVNMLKLDNAESKLSLAMTTNLQSAVHASLLLLPEEFPEEDLFLTIAGLSYNGDFRMLVGEDRNKVSNIVRPNADRFQKLYEKILVNDDHVHWNRAERKLEQCRSAASNYHHLNLLPKWLMFRLVNARSRDGRHRDTEQVLRSLANDSECSHVVQSCLAAIVRQSSITQTAKGLFTAGPKKSIAYGWSKLRKMMKI